MESLGLAYIRSMPELVPFLVGANHIDVKTVTGSVDLRLFMSGMMSYQASWVTFLYGVRAVFVRFLGMHQESIPRFPRLQPEDIPMQVGRSLAFFKVRMAKEECYWIGEVEDTHLNGVLAVIVEPLQGEQKRFHVLTVVHYQNWAGPVYFNVIRPFHHLVVGSMARAGICPTLRASVKG